MKKRVLAWIATFVVVYLAAGLLFVGPKADERRALEESISRLLGEYVEKTRQAQNLDLLRDQLRDVDALLGLVMRELPNTFDPGFAHLHGAARRRNVRIEEAKLSAEQPWDFYSRLPLRIKASGRFHDLGAFAADLDRAPGCLVLQDLSLSPASTPGHVTLEAWVLAHRYVRESDAAAQRKAAKGGKE